MSCERRVDISFTGSAAPSDLAVELNPESAAALVRQFHELVEGAQLIALETGSTADVVLTRPTHRA